MTTRRVPFFVVLIFAICLSCIGSVGKRGGLGAEALQKLPAEGRANYDLFAQKCSRCHTLDRPLNAGVQNLSHWRRYVKRMRRHPGSGISENDAERILVFLEHHMKARLAEEPSEETP